MISFFRHLTYVSFLLVLYTPVKATPIVQCGDLLYPMYNCKEEFTVIRWDKPLVKVWVELPEYEPIADYTIGKFNAQMRLPHKAIRTLNKDEADVKIYYAPDLRVLGTTTVRQGEATVFMKSFDEAHIMHELTHALVPMGHIPRITETITWVNLMNPGGSWKPQYQVSDIAAARLIYGVDRGRRIIGTVSNGRALEVRAIPLSGAKRYTVSTYINAWSNETGEFRLTGLRRGKYILEFKNTDDSNDPASEASFIGVKYYNKDYGLVSDKASASVVDLRKTNLVDLLI